MGRLSGFFKGLFDKWKGISRNKKMAFSVLFVGILLALIVLGKTLGTTKYDVLFSNLDTTDSATVYQKLKDLKVDTKVQGNSILVPKDQVDQVRMQVLSQVTLTNGSQGFELLDKSKFGSTDEEIKINYQRALQGELERTIKGFSQVDSARVHLVIPEQTAFVKDTSAGSASVTLKLKTGQQLTQDEVKAVVALISGSVQNIPKENVQVLDDKMNLLSQGLYDGNNSSDSTTSTEKQQQLTNQYEKQAETKLLSMLEAVYGKGKVKVNVNADLNFDAVQNDTTTYDPKSVVISEHNVTSTNGNGTSTNTTTNNGTGATNTSTNNGGTASNTSNSTTNTATNSSNVDNNMVNSISGSNNSGTTNTQDVTRNYDVSKVEQKTVKAPGSVKRLTTSVVLDGNIDDASKNSVRNLVVSAIGYDDKRGDVISVEGLPFDTTAKDAAKKDLDDMNKAALQAKRLKIFETIGAAVGALAILGIILFALKKRKPDEELDMEPHSIDVVLGDEDENTIEAVKKQKFKPIEMEVEDEKSHVEKEIKKYAKDKPEQVAEIIKSWLAEDER